MEWGKIKSILICIFAIVNVFLFYMYFKGTYSGQRLDSEVIANTVHIMESNSISIDESIIPRSYENIKICNIENSFKNTREMIEYITKNNEGVVSRLLKNAKISEDGMSFLCETADGEITKDNASDIIKKSGFMELSDYKEEEKKDGTYFYLRFENKIFFDSYIKVRYKGNKVSEISGHNWLGDRLTEGSVAEAVSPAEILISFASKYDGDKTVIESIIPGYYIGNRNGAVMASASPVWEITLNDGSKYYYDMRNGDLL